MMWTDACAPPPPGLVDPARVSIVGGSHGGFLTGHLLGQHPDLFRCGVMRNPVTNIAAMVGLSDIPDWCYVEVMGSEVRGAGREGARRRGGRRGRQAGRACGQEDGDRVDGWGEGAQGLAPLSGMGKAIRQPSQGAPVGST